jgi:hypothetical protein
MPSSGVLRCVALVITDVSEERSASIIKVTRIGELVPPKRRFSYEPHGVISQKTAFFFLNCSTVPSDLICHSPGCRLTD